MVSTAAMQQELKELSKGVLLVVLRLCGPVMNCRLVQVVTQPSACDSWD